MASSAAMITIKDTSGQIRWFNVDQIKELSVAPDGGTTVTFLDGTFVLTTTRASAINRQIRKVSSESHL